MAASEVCDSDDTDETGDDVEADFVFVVVPVPEDIARMLLYLLPSLFFVDFVARLLIVSFVEIIFDDDFDDDAAVADDDDGAYDDEWNDAVEVEDDEDDDDGNSNFDDFDADANDDDNADTDDDDDDDDADNDNEDIVELITAAMTGVTSSDAVAASMPGDDDDDNNNVFEVFVFDDLL